MDYIFVYGTLRRDHGGEASLRFQRRARFVGRATAAGRLYSVSWYPALVEARHQVDRVTGELFAFTEPDLLEELDLYEECSPANDHSGEYRRVRRTVNLKDAPPWESGTREAWTYIYNPPVEESKRILSGDFLEYRRRYSGLPGNENRQD